MNLLMPGGRPSDYTEYTANEICRRLAEGESLTKICSDPGYPNRATVYDWCFNFPEFDVAYRRAREQQAETYVDEIVSLADNAGEYEIDKARLKIDTRKWAAAKLNRRYAERKVIAGDPDAPLAVEKTYVLDVSHITDEAELDALERALNATIAKMDAVKLIEHVSQPDGDTKSSGSSVDLP